MNRRILGLVVVCALATGLTPACAGAPIPREQRLGYAFRLKHNLTENNFKSVIPQVLEEAPDEVRDHLKRVFLSYVEKPEQVRVDIAPTTHEQLKEGRFPRIVFEFKRGLFETIQIEHLYAEFVGSKLNYEELLVNDRIRVLDQGRIDYITEIDEADLNKAVFNSGKKLNVRNPRIELRNGSVRFSGNVKHGLGYTFVRVDGTMRVVDKTKIHFQPSSLKIGFLPLPQLVAREVFQRINPVADLAKLSFTATPDLIVPRQDRIFVLTRALQDEIPGKDDPK